ncbi:hypothetical protein PTI98_000328 [Pleurotus ostreatus]|nr:hypothetical protein PTI98_000328 [Pleurotus ostreatus]
MSSSNTADMPPCDRALRICGFRKVKVFHRSGRIHVVRRWQQGLVLYRLDSRPHDDVPSFSLGPWRNQQGGSIYVCIHASRRLGTLRKACHTKPPIRPQFADRRAESMGFVCESRHIYKIAQRALDREDNRGDDKGLDIDESKRDSSGIGTCMLGLDRCMKSAAGEKIEREVAGATGTRT